jgi:Predicted membrane protein (DUF2207) N-terminal domain
MGNPVGRLARFLPFAFCLLSSAVGGCAASAPGVRSVEQLDIQLALAPYGSVQVREQMTVHFDGSGATSFERQVDDGGRSDGLQDVTASLDSQEAIEGTGPGQVSIDLADRLVVRWHFTPASNVTHVFELQYRATGVVEIQGMRGTFSWPALPAPRQYEIGVSRLSLILPLGTRLLGSPRVDAPGWQWTNTAGVVVATKRGIPRAEPAVVTTELALDAVPMAEPRWQTRAALARQLIPAFIAAGLFILITAGGILWAIHLQYFRRPGDPDGGDVAARREVARGLRISGIVVIVLGVLAAALVYAILQRFGSWAQSVPASLVLVGVSFVAAGIWFRRQRGRV